MTNGRRSFYIIVAIFACALIIRVNYAWPALTGEMPFHMGDDDDYYAIAMSLVDHGVLGVDGTATGYRMPLFPIFLALSHFILGPEPYAALPVLIVLSALTCVGVYLLGCQMFDEQVGMIAGVICMFDSALVFYSSTYLTETLITFLVLGAMLTLERTRASARWYWAVAAGIFLGMATLTRANFGPFALCAIGWLVYTKRQEWRPTLRNGVIIMVIFGCCWGGWIARNYMVFGTFIPFTTQGGFAYYGVYNDIAANRDRLGRYGYWNTLPLPATVVVGSNEIERDQLAKALAFAWIREHPQDAIQMTLMQVVHFWRQEMDAPSYWLILALSIVGLMIAIRQPTPVLALWVALTIVLTLLTLVSLGLGRFRLPLHPFLAVLAAYAAALSWRRIMTKRMSMHPLIDRELDNEVG